MKGDDGDGRGEYSFSSVENSVEEGDVVQPKKVPNLEEPGDLGKGLSLLTDRVAELGSAGVLSACPRCKCGGVAFRVAVDILLDLLVITIGRRKVFAEYLIAG